MTKTKIVVQKYGGSSVDSLEKMAMVAKYLKKMRDSGKKLVVVVSAMGKTTDNLMELAEKSFGGKLPSQGDIQAELNNLLITGEEQAAPLLALSLWRLGVPAISLTSREIELEASQAGKVKIIRGINEIISLLKQNKVVIVTGYQGIKEKGVTTLGRGGSDITAIALAASLGLKYCENYTDVDGIFTVDPRIVPRAKRFRQISYYQLVVLASVGGGKLMDRAVILAQNLGVEIQILLSPSFGKSRGGTRVCSGSTLEKMEYMESQPGLAIRELEMIRISNIPNKPGMAGKIFGALNKVNLENNIQAPSGKKAVISILLLPGLANDALRALKGIKSDLLSGIKIGKPVPVAELTLVDPLMDRPGYSAKVCQAIANVGVNIECISSPGITIAVVIPLQDVEKAALSLAKEFHLLA